jgi:Transposase DDE domain
MAQGCVWDCLTNALTAGHDAAGQMIDTSIVRVYQHGACIAGNSEQLMGRSRGGLTTKIHAVVDNCGLPVRLALTTGEAHDNRLVPTLLSGLKSGAMLLADRGFDADWIRELVSQHGAWATILRSETGWGQSDFVASFGNSSSSSVVTDSDDNKSYEPLQCFA